MKGGHQRDALTFSDDLRRNASKATGRIKFKEELLALFSLLLWTGAEPRGGTPHDIFDALFFLICINVCTYLICIKYF